MRTSATRPPRARRAVDERAQPPRPGRRCARARRVRDAARAARRTDPVRVRLAMLYVVARANPQDDLRALQLLDNVARSPGGSVAVKQLASVLQAQISERMRAVREEQLKADAAIQKLEALRAMERS